MAQEKHHDIAVSAATQYLPEQSDEASGRYVFAYTITLRNAGSVADHSLFQLSPFFSILYSFIFAASVSRWMPSSRAACVIVPCVRFSA